MSTLRYATLGYWHTPPSVSYTSPSPQDLPPNGTGANPLHFGSYTLEIPKVGTGVAQFTIYPGPKVAKYERPYLERQSHPSGNLHPNPVIQNFPILSPTLSSPPPSSQSPSRIQKETTLTPKIPNLRCQSYRAERCVAEGELSLERCTLETGQNRGVVFALLL